MNSSTTSPPVVAATEFSPETLKPHFSRTRIEATLSCATYVWSGLAEISDRFSGQGANDMTEQVVALGHEFWPLPLIPSRSRIGASLTGLVGPSGELQPYLASQAATT
jgi:hypothetical protein